jgi:hypothetical protein
MRVKAGMSTAEKIVLALLLLGLIVVWARHLR